MLQFDQMRREKSLMGVLGKTFPYSKERSQKWPFFPAFSLCVIRSRTLAAILVLVGGRSQHRQQGKGRESPTFHSVMPGHCQPSEFSQLGYPLYFSILNRV